MLPAPLRDLSHDELVVRFRAGDEAAFTEIHRRFRAVLTVFARRMMREFTCDAEDVVQDAFLRAYVGLRATDRPMTLRPWLYMIVRNRAIDVLEAKRCPAAFDDAIGVGVGAMRSSDPAERLDRSEEMRRLVAEIAGLPERQRIALVMRELDGRSHAETARAMHTTVSATKALITRARSQLQSAMHAA